MSTFRPGVSQDTALMTVNEVAENMRCAKRTVERLIEAGSMSALRVGRMVRVERREFEDFLRRQREGSNA